MDEERRLKLSSQICDISSSGQAFTHALDCNMKWLRSRWSYAVSWSSLPGSCRPAAAGAGAGSAAAGPGSPAAAAEGRTAAPGSPPSGTSGCTLGKGPARPGLPCHTSHRVHSWPFAGCDSPCRRGLAEFRSRRRLASPRCRPGSAAKANFSLKHVSLPFAASGSVCCHVEHGCRH